MDYQFIIKVTADNGQVVYDMLFKLYADFIRAGVKTLIDMNLGWNL